MPSGYTAAIAKGITFEQYVMSCARAMGALVLMRDEPHDAPIPDRFEPSDYHAKALKKAQEDLVWLQQMPAVEAEREAAKEYEEKLAQNTQWMQEGIDLRNKYHAMLAQVVEWQPPTSEHNDFKKFMTDQITESIRFDCNGSYYKDNAPVRLSGVEWVAQKVASAQKDIGYHSAEYQKDVERTEARNAWVKALRDSLKP